MLIAAAFLSLLPLAATIPPPFTTVLRARADECPDVKAMFDLGDFNTFSFQACERFFGDGATLKEPTRTAHIWVDEKSEYFKITWKLEGDVSKMGMGSCQYAFTNREAFDYNEAKGGKICRWEFRGGQQWIKGTGVVGWEFRKDDRTYLADITTESHEEYRRHGGTWNNDTFWE